jgi:hypothetical protein
MDTEIFGILLTNFQKCLEKILFKRRSDSKTNSDKNDDSVQRVKNIFSKNLWT